MPNITLVVCAAPLARRAADIVASLVENDWSMSVVGTPSSAGWLDIPKLSAAVGSRPCFDYRQPEQPKSAFRPDAVVVCPATFNTVNKVAAGIADNYAVSLICESIGTATPVLVAPMVNEALSAHFAWPRSIEALGKAGVRFLNVQSGGQDLTSIESGTGGDVVDSFQPRWLVAALREMISGSVVDT